MENIEYLEKFFIKHNLSGKITVKYEDGECNDDYMSEIVFENGDTISINDIVFDIESDLENDVVDQWLVSKRETGISLMDWIGSDNHYMSNDIDLSSVEEYHKEIDSLMVNVRKNIDKVFNINKITQNEEID